MILGVTLLKKRYPLAKYLCVLLIVGGVALFLYKPNKSSAVADDHGFGFGEILLVSWDYTPFISLMHLTFDGPLTCFSLLKLVSLTLDGLTGVSQDHMRARFQTSANHMMLNINMWSTLVLGLGESDMPSAKLLSHWACEFKCQDHREFHSSQQRPGCSNKGTVEELRSKITLMMFCSAKIWQNETQTCSNEDNPAAFQNEYSTVIQRGALMQRVCEETTA